jgi:hypothetical protein
MTILLRKLVAFLMGSLIVAYGAYKFVMLLAYRGWLLPDTTCQSLIAFSNSIPDWQRVILFFLLMLLPIAYVWLLWRSRRIDRMIRVAPGTFLQESAISGFLRGAVSDLDEVKSITARCRMIRDEGLEVNCHVSLESTASLEEIQGRLRGAVRACMAERLGVVPLADVIMTVDKLEADRGAREAAQRGSRVMPAESPAGAQSSRATVDLAPDREDDDEPTILREDSSWRTIRTDDSPPDKPSGPSNL